MTYADHRHLADRLRVVGPTSGLSLGDKPADGKRQTLMSEN